MYSFHRCITRKTSCPYFTAYLNTHKTTEESTGTKEAGNELDSKVDRIPYTKKNETGNDAALVDKDFISIISNKTGRHKMAARAVNNKSHMTQEKEKTLLGLYRYYSCMFLHVFLSTTSTVA